MKHPRYIIADAEAARQRRAAEFAQDFERPPGVDPASYDNAPPCAHCSPEVAAAFGLDKLAKVAPHLVKIDLPNSEEAA